MYKPYSLGEKGMLNKYIYIYIYSGAIGTVPRLYQLKATGDAMQHPHNNHHFRDQTSEISSAILMFIQLCKTSPDVWLIYERYPSVSIAH